MHARTRKIVLGVILVIVVPALMLTALGLRTLYIYMTDSPLVRALPSGASDIHEWTWTEPGPLGQDGSYMLKARLEEDRFWLYRTRLGMKKHTPEKQYDHGFTPSWTSLADEDLPWWDPSESLDDTFVLDQGSAWVWAKWENGHVYVMSWSI